MMDFMYAFVFQRRQHELTLWLGGTRPVSETFGHAQWISNQSTRSPSLLGASAYN